MKTKNKKKYELESKKRKKIIEVLEDLVLYGQCDGVEKGAICPTIALNQIIKIINK